MQKLYLYLICSLMTASTSFSQQALKPYMNPFDSKWVAGVDGAVTIPMTDFKMEPNVIGGISLTNYFYSTERNTFGVRILAKGGYLSGEYDKSPGFTPSPTKFKTEIWSLGGGLEYLYHADDSFLPYLFLGASHLWFDPKDNNSHRILTNARGDFKRTDILAQGEIGLKMMFSEDFSLNISAMYNHSFTDRLDAVQTGDTKDGFLAVGLGFSFILNPVHDTDLDGVIDDIDKCPNTPAGVKVDEFGCPLDSDGDGIPDYLDKCPNTPRSAKVDQSGCPIDSDGDRVADYLDKCPNTPSGVTVDKDGCPIDSDKDGVSDYLDKCPDTPAGAMVDKNGCPLDSDGDGVADYLDKCPDTPIGAKIDQNGCPIVEIPKDAPKVIDLSGKSNFATGKSTLLPAAYAELDKLVKFMKEYKETRWKVEGHTDSKGKAEMNKKLSLDRANDVVNYFVSKGIDRTRFEVSGYGPDRPLATNKTEAGRSKNRRVSIVRID